MVARSSRVIPSPPSAGRRHPPGRTSADPPRTLVPVGPLQFQIPEIRRASLADAVVLDELLPMATRYVLPGFQGPLAGPLPLGHIASLDRMLVADGTAFVVEVSMVPLAFGAWSRRDRDPGQPGGARALDPATEPARVLSLAVRSDFTGRGLAAGILEECAAAALAEGFGSLTLLAIPDAVAMCIRCGFEEVGRRVVVVDGIPRDGVEMSQRLRR